MPYRKGIDKTGVVKAAVELLEEEGVEALTLGRLAARLGIQTPSLYNHIDGLPGLQRELALVNTLNLQDCLSQAAIGRAGPEALMAIAQAYRGYIKQHPGLYQASLLASRNRAVFDPQLEQAEERVVQIVLKVLEGYEMTREDGLHAVRGLRSLVHGFASLEIAGGFGLPLDLDESFHRLVTIFVRGLE
jgi:AcrR family transcriptional regulator